MINVNQTCNLAKNIAKSISLCGRKNYLDAKSLLSSNLSKIKGNLGLDTLSLSNTCNFSSRIDELSISGQGSKTLKKIFSPEFKPKRRFDENGYIVTTVIDKKTQEPIEIFVKEVRENKYEFYKKINNEYEIIGKRQYNINKEEGIIEPGFMINYYNDDYSGIGIRGHQLAVEKAIKEGLECIHLNSLPKASIFHEKCLFRPLAKVKISLEDLEMFLEEIATELSITTNKAVKFISYQKVDNAFILDLKQTVINLNEFIAKNDPEKLIVQATMGNYSLSGAELELWKDMVRTQPMIL